MIGFFDSGFGGLTVLRRVVETLPQYDYLYLGDNARAPYGSRSQKVVYEFTREAVNYLFRRGCPLIVIACNTSSAKALRRIQQEYLPVTYPDRRVLGVVRPLAEEVAERGFRKVGLLATEGVVASEAYLREIEKLDPSIRVFQKACPMLVPIIEAGEQDWEGAGMIVRRYLGELLAEAGSIEALLLACTHYPILYDTIRRNVAAHIEVLEQGSIVAEKLKDYLHRHTEMEQRLTRGASRTFLTTDLTDRFDRLAQIFFGEPLHSRLISFDDEADCDCR
ncbi:MAG TPA: glutamate racemase [Syntrophales bacterium]|nr:glutamate racemase [Syntrophales bacterium]